MQVRRNTAEQKSLVRACVAAAVLLVAVVACRREAAEVAPPAAQAPASAGSTAPPAAAPKPEAPASPPAAPPTAGAAASTAASTALPMEAVAVTSATLGNAVNADKRVTAATDTFRPQDTIFVSVETSGTGGASLTARWTYGADAQGTRVNEETQKVPPGGPSVTEFHIRKPDGWPAGEYQVAILVNGEAAVTRKFSVK